VLGDERCQCDLSLSNYFCFFFQFWINKTIYYFSSSSV